SLPRRRTLRALAFMTVLPRVTCPSPAMATLSPRRTETMVVAWNTWGFWLGSMRPPGVEPLVWGSAWADARVRCPDGDGVHLRRGPVGQSSAGHAVNPRYAGPALRHSLRAFASARSSASQTR